MKIIQQGLHFMDSKLLIRSITIIALISFLLKAVFLFTRPVGAGDEGIFLDEFNYLQLHGWHDAIAHKTPLTFFILVYPLTLLLSTHHAFFITNCLLFLFLTGYLYKRNVFQQPLSLLYYLFFCESGWFIIGTNDPLFIVAIVVFFYESYLLLSGDSSAKLSIALSGLIIAFFTRELILIYIPLALLTLFLFFKKGKLHGKGLVIPGILFLLLCYLNIPSFKQNKGISYDDKTPDAAIQSTWPQRQYLAQLLVNEGKLPNHQHPSFEETDAYLKKNGPQSLPKTVAESITFDIELTVKEFFKDFAESLFYSMRNSGLIVLFVCFYFIQRLLKRDFKNLYLPVVIIATIAIFSFIIISYVEGRWLVPAFLLSLLFFTSSFTAEKKYTNLIRCNNLIVIAVLCFGILRVVPKLL